MKEHNEKKRVTKYQFMAKGAFRKCGWVKQQ